MISGFSTAGRGDGCGARMLCKRVDRISWVSSYLLLKEIKSSRLYLLVGSSCGCLEKK